MIKKDKHRAPGFEKFLNYLRGLLSNKEMHAFEKEIMQDPFSEEAYEGLSGLAPDEIIQDVEEISHAVQDQTQKRGLLYLPVMRYAAAAIIVLALGTVFIILRRSVDKLPATGEVAQIIDTVQSVPEEKSFVPDTLEEKLALADMKSETQGKIKKHPIPRKEEVILVPSEEETGTGIVREPIAQLTEKKSIRADESLLETTYSEEIIYEDEKRTGSTESLRGKASGLDISSDYQPEGTAGEAPEIALSSAAFKERMSRDKMTVKGRVIGSADGDPLPGVNVTVKGTSVGTVSDMEGNFSIEVPENAEPVLAINYIGYVSEEVDVTDSRDITLALSEDLLALDEVVVVGYGVQKKSDETGSVSTLTAEQITEQASKAPIIVEPKPNGGLREYKDHIEKNIRYDLLPPFEKTQVVRVKFTVMTSGEIINIFILKSAGKAFDDEAIRLIKEGPPWEPGTVEGVPAEDDVYLRIKFQPR